MDDLAAFIEARLDEDEAAAMAWKVPSWGEDASEWKAVGARLVRYDNGCTEGFTAIDVSGRPAMFAEAIQVRWDTNGERVAHIARHDPARVLREVAAKRQRLAYYLNAQARLDHIIAHPGEASAGDQGMWLGKTSAARMACRSDAVIWNDHGDYRAEWATA